MAKPGLYAPATSIKSRLLVLLLVMTTVAIASIALVAILVNQISGKNAQKISSTALLSQAEIYLVQITEGNARENDLVLDQVKRETQKIAEYAASVFNSPEVFSVQGFWKAEEHMAYGPNGQYANDTTDITSVFVPEFAEVDQATIRDIELGAQERCDWLL